MFWLMHEARVRFLKSSGYSEVGAEGCGTIMLDSVITYERHRLLRVMFCRLKWPPEAFVKKLGG